MRYARDFAWWPGRWPSIPPTGRKTRDAAEWVAPAQPPHAVMDAALPGVDQDPGEEAGQCLVAVQREHVRDVLVRADDDDAARVAVDASQLEDVADVRVGAEHLLVVGQAEPALVRQQHRRHLVHG